MSNDSVSTRDLSRRVPGRQGALGALSREAKNSKLTRRDTPTTLPGTSSCAPASPPPLERDAPTDSRPPARSACRTGQGEIVRPRPSLSPSTTQLLSACAPPHARTAQSHTERPHSHFPAWPAMGCSRPFSLAACECLTLRLPPPRPRGRPRRCLPATITHVATVGPLFVLRVRYVLRERNKNGTERGLQRSRWSPPPSEPRRFSGGGKKASKVVWHGGPLA